MEPTVYAAIMVATVTSVARTGWGVLGFLRTLIRPSESIDIKWDWSLLLVAPEVLLPAISALWLSSNDGASPPYGDEYRECQRRVGAFMPRAAGRFQNP